MSLNEYFQKTVKVAYSPFRELICSLHVLHYPDHHTARLDWANDMSQSMSGNLKKHVFQWGEVTHQWLKILDFVDLVQFEESYPEQVIDQIRYVESDTFRGCILGSKMDRPFDELSELERAIKDEPNRMQKVLSDLLYEYHQKHFSRELFRVEPWLIKTNHELMKDIETNPLIALQKIHPRFKLNDQEIVFYKAQTWRYAYSDLSSITIYPSTFISPHLLVGIETADIVVYQHVNIPGKVEQKVGVPEDLLRVTKALADKSRLQLLQMLLFHPYCTQQLEEIIGLAKATISKHLKVLVDARLVYTERRGHYVFYHTNKEQLEMLKVDLDQFFDQPILVKKGDT